MVKILITDKENRALSQLEQLLKSGFTRDIDVIKPWLTDWRGRYTGTALAMISPTSTQQLSRAVKICAEHDIPIVPQGGNSGMVAGATPNDDGKAIILSLRKMNRISYDAKTPDFITCEAGVILQNLHDAAAQHDMRFPLTLGGKGSATVGGLISTNAGGTQVLRHGNMRALVAGIEAVLPNGAIYDEMSALKKDNRGYDITQLLIGAEGTLGIVTKAKLKIVPAIQDRIAIWVGLESPQKAYEFLLHMTQKCADQLEGFELISESSIAKVLKHISGTRLPSDHYPWYILIELVQDSPKQTPEQTNLQTLAETALAQPIEDGLILDAVLSVNETQAEDFWKLRDSISEAERAAGPAFQHDISVPVHKMADFIENVSPQLEQKFTGCEVIAFGHLGDGNIHYHVKAPDGMKQEDWLPLEKQVNSAVYDAVIGYGGSISAEHGIGQSKLEELERVSSEARLYALRAIKKSFDPKNIMNPGKLITPD